MANKSIYQRVASYMAKETGKSESHIANFREALKLLKDEHTAARTVGGVSLLQELFEAAEMFAMKKLKKQKTK
jgi:hypothetical protein